MAEGTTVGPARGSKVGHEEGTPEGPMEGCQVRLANTQCWEDSSNGSSRGIYLHLRRQAQV
eukprot:scaffold193367_cov40-Cyclotella_meneghiniana.AAC.1